METIQIVLDKKLLQATDRAARHAKQNRSASVREALREHLRALKTKALEARDRDGYLKVPHASDRWEEDGWEAESIR